MTCLSLAFAERADTADTGLQLIVVWTAVIAGIALLTFIPAIIVRRRRHSQGDILIAVCIAWGVLSAGSVLHTSMTRAKWSHERDLRIQSGYYDPRSEPESLPLPWALWTGLGVGYAVLLIVVVAGSKTSRLPPA